MYLAVAIVMIILQKKKFNDSCMLNFYIFYHHVALRGMIVYVYNRNTNNYTDICGIVRYSSSLKCYKVSIPVCTVPYHIVELYNVLLASRYQVLPKTGTISASYLNTSVYGKSS